MIYCRGMNIRLSAYVYIWAKGNDMYVKFQFVYTFVIYCFV